MPLVFQLLSKKRGFYHSLAEYSGQYIYPNDRENTTYNRICSERMDITAFDMFKKVLLIAGGGFLGGFSTIYASFWMDNKTTTTAVKIPFIDEKSDEEFYLNFLLQWTIFVHACFLYFGIEITMTLFENFATVSPKLIHLELIESIKMYEKKELSEPQLCIAFKNAIVQSLDYDRYSNHKKSMD